MRFISSMILVSFKCMQSSRFLSKVVSSCVLHQSGFCALQLGLRWGVGSAHLDAWMPTNVPGASEKPSPAVLGVCTWLGGRCPTCLPRPSHWLLPGHRCQPGSLLKIRVLIRISTNGLETALPLPTRPESSNPPSPCMVFPHSEHPP